jgi:hypothetical protein
MYSDFDYDDGVESHNYVVTGCYDEDNFDEDDYTDCEYHRIELVEQYVTYANAVAFDNLCSWKIEGDPNAWLEEKIGFPDGHWAHQFVADELEALLK